jgi:diguanylate cyclase (GGDEF)-like protein
MMPETDLKGALVVGERYRKRIEEFTMVKANKPLKITISLGVACYPHPKIRTVDDLIRLADNALYEAKKYGRNRVEVAG